MFSLNNDDEFDQQASFNETIWPANTADDIGQQKGNVLEKVSSIWLKIVLLVLLLLLFSIGLLFLFVNDKMNKFQLAMFDKLDQNFQIIFTENKLKVNENFREIEAIISEAIDAKMKIVMPFVIGMVIGACLLFILLKVNGGKEEGRGEMEKNKKEKGRGEIGENEEEEGREKELVEDNDVEKKGREGMEDNEEEEEGREGMEENNGEEERGEMEENNGEERKGEMEESEEEEEGREEVEKKEEEGREEMEEKEEERREGICQQPEKNRLKKKQTFCCAQCQKNLSSARNLVVHMRTHTGERPYKCNDCGKGFSRMSNLKEHRHVHTGEKNYSCGVCGKRFARMSNLKEHRHVHMEKKAYVMSKK